jgi:uncharacterized protein
MTEPVTPELAARYERLVGWFDAFDRIAIAFSGGVDSTVVLAAARENCQRRGLSQESIVPLMCVSPSQPAREVDAAIAVAENLGFQVCRLNTSELDQPGYVSNQADRCYHCKKVLLQQMFELVQDLDCEVLVTGDNASDLLDERPGRRALQEAGGRSPLAELGITKPEVRAIARDIQKLPVWNKPARACLATRVPAGTPITAALLARIEKAEDALADLGFTEHRVRHAGSLARLEVSATEMPLVMQKREAILAALKQAGYDRVALDLEPLARR